MTPCDCTGPGFCERHGCHKSRHWWRLCRSRFDRFQEWEAGDGPGQESGSILNQLRIGGPEITVLMVTFNRLEYTRVALPALLASDDVSPEIVVWDNASTDGTREWLVKHYSDDPRVGVILWPHNVGCVHPMNVVWRGARTPLVAKVDNDTLIPPQLLATLAAFHRRSRQWGVLSGCHFHPGDVPDFEGQAAIDAGMKVYRRPHVGGCAVMMRQSLFAKLGPIACHHAGGSRPFLESSWTEYQDQLSRRGFVNGYPLPLTFVDHMEDTRSDHCVLSAEHEAYKTAMRGQTLEECTMRLYVAGAQTAFSHRSVVPIASQSPPAAEPGRVTLFCPLAGRTALWPGLARFLEHQSWPRDQISLVLFDTSQDEQFGRQVREWTATCTYPDVRVVRGAVGPAGIADQPRREATREVQRAMATIYRRLQSLLQTEFVWILEDDIVPPTNVCARLMRLLADGHGSAAAPYRSRFGNRYVVWNRSGRNLLDRGLGFRQVGGNGFGCVLMRAEVFLRAKFRLEEDCDRSFYRQLNEWGGTAGVDWGSESQHQDAVPGGDIDPEIASRLMFNSPQTTECVP